MPDTATIPLPGCRPEPLMSYLKALGVLRTVSEQADTAARASWADDALALHTHLDPSALRTFFLEAYRPTPVIAPWNAAGGFYGGGAAKPLGAIEKTEVKRLQPYRQAIEATRRILRDEHIDGAPKDEDKQRLLQALRRRLPDALLPWLDATYAVTADKARFAPMLGVGAVDGRLEFTNNLMQRVLDVIPSDGTTSKAAPDWLEASLFSGTSTPLVKAAVGQFHPAGAAGANATQGFEAKDSLVNPWDFILMMEGALLLAGGAARRHGSDGGSWRAAFPFSAAPTPAGWGSLGAREGNTARGELWLPLWNRPTHLRELQAVFSEGRADVGRRKARDGLDFARAAVSLGVDKGITSFQRYGFLQRNGLAFFAAPLGRVTVAPRAEAELLSDVDPWLASLRRASGNDGIPAKVPAATRELERAMFDYCLQGGRRAFQRTLIAVGATEKAAASLGDPTKAARAPMQALSKGWVQEADDASPEFRLAEALASLHDRKLGGLRIHMESVERKGRRYAWAERSASQVWAARSLERNLSASLGRRLLDAEVLQSETPLAAVAHVPVADVLHLLAGRVDTRQVEALLWGLICLEKTPSLVETHVEVPPTTPASYALLKLLFLPRSLRWEGEDVDIAPSMEVLRLLERGDGNAAVRIAARRLRGKGLVPRTSDIQLSPEESRRLAAALLIPIHDRAPERLAELVLRRSRQETPQEEEELTS